MSQVQKLTNEQDEANSFGEHVAARLRTFTPRQRALACVQIDCVLFDTEFPNDHGSVSMNLRFQHPSQNDHQEFPSSVQYPFANSYSAL